MIETDRLNVCYTPITTERVGFSADSTFTTGTNWPLAQTVKVTSATDETLKAFQIARMLVNKEYTRSVVVNDVKLFLVLIDDLKQIL